MIGVDPASPEIARGETYAIAFGGEQMPPITAEYRVRSCVAPTGEPASWSLVADLGGRVIEGWGPTREEAKKKFELVLEKWLRGGCP